MKGKPKLLIVEDQAEILSLMIHALNRAGCEVSAAQTGAEGMRMAQDGLFDLITLDIDLPDANGFELCAQLKKNVLLRHVPVIFVSGRHSETDKERAFELGALDYITKPFRLASFVSTVLSFTDQAVKE
jgi:DNA-binding response OmpR family regulator